MIKLTSLRLALTATALLCTTAQAGEPKWKKHEVNPKSEFEAAGVLDVDNDGRLDILSGDTWYQAPAWTPHKVRDVTRQGTYYNCFGTLPVDGQLRREDGLRHGLLLRERTSAGVGEPGREGQALDLP